jgi:hypothetical protein
LRELGTRDRILGDANFVRPLEHKSECAFKDDDESSVSDAKDSHNMEGYGELGNSEKIDLNKDALFDINKYRFNKNFQNFLHSTSPLVPKFHSTFGQPIERQEISYDIDPGRNTDAKK